MNVNLQNDLHEADVHAALQRANANPTTAAQDTALRNLLIAAGACGAEDMYQNTSTAPALQHDNCLHILQLTLRTYLNTQGEGFGEQ